MKNADHFDQIVLRDDIEDQVRTGSPSPITRTHPVHCATCEWMTADLGNHLKDLFQIALCLGFRPSISRLIANVEEIVSGRGTKPDLSHEISISPLPNPSAL